MPSTAAEMIYLNDILERIVVLMINENEVRNWFTAEVKERMADAGLEPYHMSHLCKMKHDNVYGYLHGKPFPRLWNMILLAECLDCSVNDLLGYNEPGDINVFERLLASKTYMDEIDFAGHFSKRFIRIMDEYNTLPEELSEQTGIGLNTINHWINKEPLSLPTVMQLLRICDALDCTPSDLLGY